MNTDPIADMLTRIRNAILVNKSDIILPYSLIKEQIAKLLVENNFIDSFKVKKDQNFKYLLITLSSDNQNARISEIKKLSKPGKRIYVPVSRIPKVKQGRGIVIMSTSKGLLTGEEARKNKVGGELICQVV